MRIYTEEFQAMKIAVGIAVSHREEMTDRERHGLQSAIDCIRRAEKRLEESNRKQAEVMRSRRKKLQEVM